MLGRRYGKDMTDPLDLLDDEERRLLRQPARAEWRQPMLATLTHDRFSHPDWVFEPKLDGVRAIVVRSDGEVSLWSRNRKDISASYPELVEAFAQQPTDNFVADGEIVAFDDGLTSFAKLQARIHLTDPVRIAATGVDVFIYLFDLLVWEEVDLTDLPLLARKRVLREAFQYQGPLRYSSHRETHGEEYYQQACAHGWEGLIAKRASSRYQEGRRSRDWLKLKCVRDQEFVIGGFTDPAGSRQGFGALLVGYYDKGRLRYAGKVGTGYSDQLLRDLRAQLDQLAQRSSPFAEPVRERGVHWVRPELVVQIGFTEWTSDGKLRHPRFLGQRQDKDPTDVVRES